LGAETCEHQSAAKKKVATSQVTCPPCRHSRVAVHGRIRIALEGQDGIQNRLAPNLWGLGWAELANDSMRESIVLPR